MPCFPFGLGAAARTAGQRPGHEGRGQEGERSRRAAVGEVSKHLFKAYVYGRPKVFVYCGPKSTVGGVAAPGCDWK